MRKKCEIAMLAFPPVEAHEESPDVIIDGATKIGIWGYMCIGCHRVYGLGLGIGKGTKLRQVKKGDNWQLEKVKQ